MNIPEANSTPKTWKTFFVKDGRLRPIWLLLSYLPVLGLAALRVVWPVITLLNMLGCPSLPSEQVPGNWGDLAAKEPSDKVIARAQLIFKGTEINIPTPEQSADLDRRFGAEQEAVDNADNEA